MQTDDVDVKSESINGSKNEINSTIENVIGKMAENAKVAIRNVRRDATDAVKKLEKAENLPEDAVKDGQDQVSYTD